jgi:hypothetical protein
MGITNGQPSRSLARTLCFEAKPNVIDLKEGLELEIHY